MRLIFLLLPGIFLP